MASSGWRRFLRSGWAGRVALLGLAAAWLVLATALGHGSAPVGAGGIVAQVSPASTPAGPASSPSAPSVEVAPMPAGPAFPGLPDQPQLLDLVGDPSGKGAWFVAPVSTGADLVHWQGGSLQTWLVGPGGGGLNSALAVGPGGVAWVGLGTTLYRVDTATGAVTPIPVPTVGAVSNDPTMHLPGLAGLQAGLQAGLMWISALAVGPAGEVAIAHNAGNAVQVYHPGSASFSTVPLPAQTEVSGAVLNGALAFDASGVLAISLADFGGYPQARAAVNELALWQDRQPLAVLPIAAYGVYAAGSGFVAASDGGVLTVTGPPGSSVTAMSPLPVGSNGDRAWAGGQTLKDGASLAYNTVSGIAVVPPSGVLTDYRLPGYTCYPGTASEVPEIAGSGPHAVPSPPPTGPQTCTQGVRELAADAAGNLWYVSSGPGTPVGELPGGDLPR